MLFILGGFLVLPEIFIFVFGEEWVKASIFAKWLTVWLGILLINSPAQCTLMLKNKQKFNLKFDILLTMLRLLTLVLGGYYYDEITTVTLFSIVGAVANAYLIIYVFLFLKKRGRLISE